MPTERPIILPNIGSPVKDLQNRADIGKDRLLEPWNQHDVGYDFDEEKIELVRRYRLPKKDITSTPENLALLMPCIDSLRRKASAFGIALPDDLPSRVVIAGSDEAFKNAVLQEEGINYYAHATSHIRGYALYPTRIALVNRAAIRRTARATGVAYETVLKRIVTHEVVHSCAAVEMWAGYEGGLEGASIKRSGLYKKGPNVQTNIQIGRWLLNEAVTDLLADEAMEEIGEDTSYSPYPSELAVGKLLRDALGSGILYHAEYHDQGDDLLTRVFDENYWEGAYDTLARVMTNDFRTGTTQTDYTRTTDYKRSTLFFKIDESLRNID